MEKKEVTKDIGEWQERKKRDEDTFYWVRKTGVTYLPVNSPETYDILWGLENQIFEDSDLERALREHQEDLESVRRYISNFLTN